jgi:UDP-glucose 4-epimerase
MRVAITGSTGLIGGAVAARLLARGHDLVRIGRGATADVRADLATIARLPRGALDGCEVLVHAAGVTDEDFANRARANAKAETGARALMEAAGESGVTRCAYFSSAHVYGPLQGCIDESHAPDPRSDYARAHVATERLFREWAGNKGCAALVTRPCAVYGMPPSLENFARWSLIPFDFPRQALTGRIVLRSPGMQRRNFVPAEGLAALVERWLEGATPGLTLANAPGRDELAVFEFAALCARIAHEELGRDCAVERPAPAGDGAPALEYRSRVEGDLPGPSLQDHARALMRALSKKGRS